MSEISRSEQPENIELTAKETINRWERELPPVIHNWYRKKGDEASPEEVFKYYDEYVEKLKNDSKTEESWQRAILENSDTNNFHLFFRQELAQDILNGEMEAYGIKPFYINSRFNNAWNQMCKKFYDDIVLITQFEETAYGRRRTNDNEKQSLKKLAMYLMDKGVPASFLGQ